MKVLIVTNMYPQEGLPYYGIFVKEQKEAIKRFFSKIDFHVYFIDGKNDKMSYIKSIYKIHRLLKKEHFDLIHIHYGFAGLFLLYPLPYKIPTIVTLHGGDIQIEQKKEIQVFFTKLILKKAEIAITLNPRMDDIARQYISNTQIIPCSVNTDFFKPISIQKINSIKNIIFPSNKNRFEKNYSLFEKTINILRNRYQIECTISEIKNLSRQQVLELYNSADLMLMTSISEGSPQVVKEAMACNLPVVSTNVGDVINLLNGVKNSAVSTSFNENELAHLCYKALNNKIEGINGRDKITQLEIDDKNVSSKIYQIYTSLTSNK